MSDTAPLSRLTDFYGNSALIEDDPLCVPHRDILYVPQGTPGTSHGLFDRGRKILGAAADYRAQPHPTHPYDAFTTLDPEKFDYAPDDVDYVFLGLLTGHYGHFITASLARLWVARLTQDTRTRYVVLNNQPVGGFFEIQFISEILGAAGLTPQNVVSFNQPTRFRRITVPSPAIEEHNFSHRIFGTLCARIGDLMVPQQPPKNDTPVFLGKARLASGVSKVVNEEELCDCLVNAGVEIVYPETLNMPEKVALFRSRSFVTGLAGSGMHSAVFAPNHDKLALTFTPYLLSNQLLLDQASGSTTVTYVAESITEPEAPGWQTIYRLVDPVKTAGAFLRLIECELRPRVERRRDANRALSITQVREVGHFRFCFETAGSLVDFQGWCEMERAQCWTSGPVSFFDLVLLPSQGELTLSLRVDAALAPPHLVSRPLTVFANDVQLTQFTINRLKVYSCILPRKCLDGRALHLRFEHPVIASPFDMGRASDKRDISISFEEITVTEDIS